MKSPSEYLIRLQDRIGKLLDANGTRMPAFNDELDAVIARHALAGIIAKKANDLVDDAKGATIVAMQNSLGVLADGAPAMSIYQSSFVNLNAEKRARETTDAKVLINGLVKLAEDNPKLSDRINSLIKQSKKKGYSLYLTSTLNGIPE